MGSPNLDRNEVIKHSAAIHISNTLTHTQRMVSNVLLKNAFKDLLSDERHQIKISTLLQSIDCNTRNIKAVKDILSVLATTKLEWNILDKDKKNRWGVSALLAYAEIKSGVCSYEYSAGLRKIFSNPNIYARLNLLIQRQFKCGHTLAIWEYLMEFLCSTGFKSGYTDWLSVEAFKKLLGTHNDPLYKEFKYVGQRLVKKPLKKINEVSDISAEVEYERKKRKVVALRFKVARKENYQLPLDMPLPPDLVDVKASATQRPREKTKEPEDSSPILERLLSFGLTKKQAQKILSNHDENYITENLDIVEKNCRAGKVTKVPAYTMTAIKEDYRPKKSFLEEEQETEEKQTKAQQEQKRRQEVFEKLNIELEANRLEAAIDKLPVAKRKTLDKEFLESLQGNPNGAIALKSYKKKGLGSIMVKSVFNVFARDRLIKAPANQKELKAFIKSKGFKIGDFKQELAKIK